MRNHRVHLPSAVAILTAFASVVLGRGLENWPYERLFKEADLVVIATAQSTEDTGERIKQKEWKVNFLGRTTKFEVQSILKGKPPGDTIKVLHYKLEDGVVVNDGPLLVSFRAKGMEIQGKGFKAGVERPEYLLFLKKGKDERYEPVSGQVDPALSVREMHVPRSDLRER